MVHISKQQIYSSKISWYDDLRVEKCKTVSEIIFFVAYFRTDAMVFKIFFTSNVLLILQFQQPRPTTTKI